MKEGADWGPNLKIPEPVGQWPNLVNLWVGVQTWGTRGAGARPGPNPNPQGSWSYTPLHTPRN